MNGPNRLRASAARAVLLATLVVAAFIVLGSLGAVGVARTPAASAQGAQVPSSSAAVPVLLYHRLVAGRDAVAPAAFEAQMRRLHDSGFSAITLETYVRAMRGEGVDLPRRPILITFDDAFISSWKRADPVLARYGWSAAMYVPTGFVGLRGRLTWEQLRLMRKSGRWQIDEHAGNGHAYVAVDPAGTRLPFYAARAWIDGDQESFAEYKERVRQDIDLGARTLARRIPGWRSHGTFALPYGDYGQRRSNDPRIAPWLANFLKARFAVTFARAAGEPSSTAAPVLARRIAVSGTWDARVLRTHVLREVDRLTSRDGGRSGG